MSVRVWWRSPTTWVIVGMIVFTVWFGTTAWFRHANFYTSQFDLGNMDSVMWHAQQGRFFTMTNPTQLVQELRTATHADFLLLAGVPLYWIWADPRMLMFLQVAVVASGALAVFWLGKKWLGPAWGGLFSILYLLYPPLHWAVMFDFHAVTLATPLLLWAIWAMVAQHYWRYGIFVVLALLAKEEIGLLVGLLGLVFLITKRHRWVSLATIAAGFGWSALMLGVAIPAARSAGDHFALSYFSNFGDSPGNVLKGIVTNPGEVVSRFFNQDGLMYFATILWPLGFLSLLGLPYFLVAMPEFGINLLSSNDNLRAVYFHYTSGITPFMFTGAMIGLFWLFRSSWASQPLRRGVAIGLLFTAASSIYFWAPLPGMRHHADSVQVFKTSPYRAAVAEVKTQVSQPDRVSITNNLAPHFTQRDWTWSFPLNLANADVAIILVSDGLEIAGKPQILETIAALEADPIWELRLKQDDLYFFKRVQSLVSQ